MKKLIRTFLWKWEYRAYQRRLREERHKAEEAIQPMRYDGAMYLGVNGEPLIRMSDLYIGDLQAIYRRACETRVNYRMRQYAFYNCRYYQPRDI